MKTIKGVGSQMSIFDGENQLKITKPIRLIELFAGIGAQAKALENLSANFEHYRICEFDKYAVASYNAVHGTEFTTSDITKIHANDLGIVETDKYEYIMTYSFPCTDISKAGKQQGMSQGSGTRSSLLWEVKRILKESKDLPHILLMENVPDLLSQKNKADFFEWCGFLESLGYTNKWTILNAKDFGVPQNRERCFMLSWIGNYYYDFPTSKPLIVRLKDVLEHSVDKKYYFGKAIKYFIQHTSGSGPKIIEDFYKSRQPIEYKEVFPTLRSEKRSVKAVETMALDEQNGQGITETIKQYSRPHGFNKGGVKAIEVFPTIGCSSIKNENIGIIDGTRVRRLTPKECWRLMGFDDIAFSRAAKKVSNSQLYKQAGNSIVVPVLEEIFKQLL